jgi:UDP-N-acetylglucosamine--N-acetylmuramyl-(pentapeptide) pyrophosphoryl-undecaprenol N-acetylglucosamine transferase
MFTRNKSQNIIITTGGTGGHIVPAMKIVSDLISQGKSVYFITDARFKKYESLFMQKSFYNSPDFKLVVTPITPFKLKSFFSFAKNCILTFFQVIFTFIKARPKIVIGFGSYVSFFPLLIALITFRTIIIHEQNVVFGKVNLIFARFASSVLLSFPDVSSIPKKLYKKIKNRVIISGLPSFVENQEDIIYRKVIFDLSTKNEIVILITGGGQGSSFFAINIPPAIISIAKTYSKKTFKVYHQVRAEDVESVNEFYQKSGLLNLTIIIKPLFENIPEILKEADIAIIRGGAGSVIETASAKVFAIIIPMPNSAGDHQLKNAHMLASNNGAVMFEQQNCTSERLAMVITRVLNDNLFYFPIINTASEIFKNNASQVFTNIILYSDFKSLNSYD